LITNEKAVVKSGENHRRKELIKQQEQRENKRRKAVWGYSTAE
jgi:hypothetical protein